MKLFLKNNFFSSSFWYSCIFQRGIENFNELSIRICQRLYRSSSSSSSNLFSYTKIVRKRRYHDKILYNSNDKMNRKRNTLYYFFLCSLFCIRKRTRSLLSFLCEFNNTKCAPQNVEKRVMLAELTWIWFDFAK